MTTKTTHIFAIDIGNTRIKWALFKAADDALFEALSTKNLTVFDRHMQLQSMMLNHGNCLHDELLAYNLPIEATAEMTQVVISNVASEAILNAVIAKLKPQNNVHVFSSSASSCGIQNHYDNPQQLGSDRWAALIAAWHLHQADCVVVNAGTAVTIDVLLKDVSDDFKIKLNAFSQTHTAQRLPKAHFIGGLILPGLHLMQTSLHRNTANLFAQGNQSAITQNIDFIAKNTKNAITQGAITAICSSISHCIYQVAQQTNSAPTLIMSGGDAAVMTQHLMANAPIIVDNLVLFGLYLQQCATQQTND